jgi:hypothetical protein
MAAQKPRAALKIINQQLSAAIHASKGSLWVVLQQYACAPAAIRADLAFSTPLTCITLPPCSDAFFLLLPLFPLLSYLCCRRCHRSGWRAAQQGPGCG